MAAAGPHSSPLFDHLETLYPLARTLAGPEEADALLVRVYEEAAAHPPKERPDDLRGWLLGLLLDLSGASPDAGPSATEADLEQTSTDTFRRMVARRVAAEALPTALAACSARERFLLAMDAVEENASASTPALATALGTTPAGIEYLRSEARASLRSNLKAVLSAEEGALVDETLPDDVLEDEIRSLLTEHFSPVPSSLRGRVRTVLQQSGSEDPSGEAEPASEDESRSTPAVWGLNLRSALVGLLVLLIVAALGIGLSRLNLSSAPVASEPGLVAYSIEQASAVRPEMETSQPQEAEAYVESTWNRSIALPTIDGFELEGVGHITPGNGVDVPVLLYTSSEDTARTSVFVYNYALIDRMEGNAPMRAPLRNELATGNEVHSAEGGLLWRHEDDIYIAVPPTENADALRDRIQPPS